MGSIEIAHKMYITEGISLPLFHLVFKWLIYNIDLMLITYSSVLIVYTLTSKLPS